MYLLGFVPAYHSKLYVYETKICIHIFSIAFFWSKLIFISRIMRMEGIISDKQFANNFL